MWLTNLVEIVSVDTADHLRYILDHLLLGNLEVELQKFTFSKIWTGSEENLILLPVILIVILFI